MELLLNDCFRPKADIQGLLKVIVILEINENNYKPI